MSSFYLFTYLKWFYLCCKVGGERQLCLFVPNAAEWCDHYKATFYIWWTECLIYWETPTKRKRKLIIFISLTWSACRTSLNNCQSSSEAAVVLNRGWLRSADGTCRLGQQSCTTQPQGVCRGMDRSSTASRCSPVSILMLRHRLPSVWSRAAA